MSLVNFYLSIWMLYGGIKTHFTGRTKGVGSRLALLCEAGSATCRSSVVRGRCETRLPLFHSKSRHAGKLPAVPRNQHKIMSKRDCRNQQIVRADRRTGPFENRPYHAVVPGRFVVKRDR